MDIEKSVIYQIYPLGACGAESNRVGEQQHRLGAIEREIDRLAELGMTAVLFNPIFESSAHGYDTVDLYAVDKRLGTNAEFRALTDKLHARGISVILDGVFNHVGREFPQFEDVRAHREASRYRDWFRIDFSRNTCYNDGFWYEPWEGHYELVQLNLDNSEVQDYLLGAARLWRDELGADGIRLDVAYRLPAWFINRLRETMGRDFYLVGEMIHGDYGRTLRETGLDAVTNYECYKGIFSALNSRNLFEIEHSLSRLFGSEPWAICPGRRLLNFVDNHDVSRLFTVLTDKRDIYAAYTLLFAMPGTPCVYYGSEFSADGDKHAGDSMLRPAFDSFDRNDHALAEFIARLARLKVELSGLQGTEYKKLLLTNTALCFRRGNVIAAINIGDQPIDIPFNGESLLHGGSFNGTLAPKSVDLILE